MNMKLRDVAPALMTLLLGVLAGCGGGDGGGGGGVAVPNSALPGGTITGITVNSPPVVTFVVNDSTGKPVTGLRLSDPAATLPADAACNNANVTFAIAKFDGANWQSLISRQRYAASAPGQFPVIEGTTDPKPAAGGYINPGTAVADPNTRIVGILEEVNGVYTYRFATDVSTPLLMANAVNQKNVALGKVANDGHVAVKDGKTLHRVALQLCYVDPVTRATVKANPIMDFTLGGDGRGNPSLDSQGNLTPARRVVDRASCNECHQNFAQHGGNRVDPQYCVMCHNPGSADFETGNPIDFKLMVHKFHMGKRLTQDYAVRSAVARKDTAGVITGVLYPQDQRNCVKCHDGSPAATHRTAQGDNWKGKPSKNACWACHDDYKAAGSRWQTAHAPYASLLRPGVANPDATPDGVCQSCHNDAGGGVAKTIAKAHEMTEGVKGGSYQYNIWGITKNPDNTVSVEYSVSNPQTGVDYDLLDPQYQYTVVNTAGTTTTKTFRFGALNMLFGWNTRDYANDGAIGRAWGSSCTVAPTATPTCDATTGMPKAGSAGPIARGQPVAINALFDSSVQRLGSSNRFKLTSTVLPPAASGTLAVAFQGRVSEWKDANSSWAIPVQNVVRYFAMSGVVQERRQVVSADKCNACHGRNLAFTNVTTFQPGLGGHGGSRTDPEVCVICHNGNNPLKGTVVAGGAVTQYAESADFKRMIHRMHAEQGGNYPVWPRSQVSTDMGSLMYAGLGNCEACHVNGSYKQDQSVLGTSVTFAVDTSANSTNAPVTDTNALDNLVISPKASVCSSCHDSNGAKAHMYSVGGAVLSSGTAGGALFGSVTQAGLAAGQVFEQCDGCHLPGAMKPVDTEHLGP
jgi:OmcA/MtrC family decaheme c-type cytochrome